MSPLTREEGIRRIAAGAPFPLPTDMTSAAIAGGQSIEQFALAMAKHCSAARSAAHEDAEIDAVANRIIGSDEAPARETDEEVSASAIAREIANEARTAPARSDDAAAVDAVVRRIEEA
jgi:hypothetical protein